LIGGSYIGKSRDKWQLAIEACQVLTAIPFYINTNIEENNFGQLEKVV